MKKDEFKIKFGDQREVCHQLFIKQHMIREKSDERPSELTLFVCNVPPYCTEESLKYIFKHCGAVKSVYFANIDTPSVTVVDEQVPYVYKKENQVKGYKLAYVVFVSAKSLQKALNCDYSKPVTVDGSTLKTGLSSNSETLKWCEEYNKSFPDTVKMQQEIDQYMKNYDKEVQEKINREKKAGEADEEGWTNVTKRGRNPGFARKQSVKDNITKTISRKKRRKTLLNFYTFQIKESKMNHISELRKKFEEDKKKVQILKSQRKFRPF